MRFSIPQITSVTFWEVFPSRCQESESVLEKDEDFLSDLQDALGSLMKKVDYCDNPWAPRFFLRARSGRRRVLNAEVLGDFIQINGEWYITKKSVWDILTGAASKKRMRVSTHGDPHFVDQPA